MLEANRLYLGDCLQVMQDIGDKSIDLILCDLPYGTTACHWDTVIPFEPLWQHYKRIIKDRCAIVLFGSQPFTSALVMSNPKWFRQELIFEKNQGTNYLNANREFMRCHENIIIFSKTGYIYNPEMEEGKKYKIDHGKKINEHIRDRKLVRDITINSGTRYPKSIIKINKDKDKLHPTQKPVALLEYLIRTYTNEGALVLDSTCGSGSTCIAAMNTGRNFIGIEKDETYFNLASERIDKAQKVLKLL